jgi:lipopolysaccharide export system protein LptC
MIPTPLHPKTVRHFIENLSRPRAPLDAKKLARRRSQVALAKRLLPTLAVLLLASVALWPEIDRTADHARSTFEKLGAASTQAMYMSKPHYRGVDQRNEPYTITAKSMGEPVQGQFDLIAPMADLFLGGADSDAGWLMVWSNYGTYVDKPATLDLVGDVNLYRADGMIFSTDDSTMDLADNTVIGDARIHGEGPLGTLDGQAFALLDHGALLQIAGPVKLVLNAVGSRP